MPTLAFTRQARQATLIPPLRDGSIQLRSPDSITLALAFRQIALSGPYTLEEAHTIADHACEQAAGFGFSGSGAIGRHGSYLFATEDDGSIVWKLFPLSHRTLFRRLCGRAPLWRLS